MKEVDKYSIYLQNDEHLYDLTYGYITKTDHNVFLDPIYMLIFENRLFHHFAGEVGLFVLLSDEKKLEVSLNDDFEIHDCNVRQIDNYVNEYFLMLTKLIYSKVNFKTPRHAIYSTWYFLRNVAIKFFYTIFKNNYTSYFENAKVFTLEDYVRQYSCIETINIESQFNFSIFVYYLMHEKRFTKNNNFIECYDYIHPLLANLIENKKLNNFEKSLTIQTSTSILTIDDVDLMSGKEFEVFVSTLFNKIGYSTILTKSTGDQGIDIIAEKNGRKIGIQAKCYSSAVSNSAIQEVVAGLKYYQLDKGIVVTNNYFTKSAADLAKSNNVICWDRNILKEKINDLCD